MTNLSLQPTELKGANTVWNALTPDVFNADDAAQVAGFLQYKLEFGLATAVGPRAAIVKPTTKKFQLRAFIYQAKELPAGDKEGTSDPYCIVRLGKFSKQTKTI